jgi:hypothetical protein
MRARLPMLYSVLAFAILMGAQAARVAAQDKRATPPSAKDLVGIWIGFDSDQLTFTRLDLRLDSTGFCARVSPADTILHAQGVPGELIRWQVFNECNTLLHRYTGAKQQFAETGLKPASW